jgi:hypothetical protein
MRKETTVRPMTGRDFDALSAEEKARIVDELDRKGPERLIAESRPLNQRQRATWNGIKRQIKRKMGRPKIGRGVKVISLSVELQLLKEADAMAKRRGIKRAQLVAEGLRAVLKAS